MKILVEFLEAKDVTKTEKRDPKSLINMVEDQINRLKEEEDEEAMKEIYRKLIALLRALLTPNAQLGHIIESLMDHATTFIGNLAMAKEKKRDVSIPV